MRRITGRLFCSKENGDNASLSPVTPPHRRATLVLISPGLPPSDRNSASWPLPVHRTGIISGAFSIVRDKQAFRVKSGVLVIPVHVRGFLSIDVHGCSCIQYCGNL